MREGAARLGQGSAGQGRSEEAKKTGSGDRMGVKHRAGTEREEKEGW